MERHRFARRPQALAAPRLSRRAALAVGGAGVAAFALSAAAQDATPPASPPSASPAASPGATPVAAGVPAGGTVPHVFGYEAFQFEFLNALGDTYEQAADVGECFAAASQIADADYDGWFAAWTALGDRIRGIAEASDARGHKVSAREAYLRASTYYAKAYFFADGTRDPARLVPTWETHRACFDAFAARLDPPAAPVTIPYEGTSLPGYALTVDTSGQPRPWVVLNNGSDGTATDMWVQGAAAARRRGYNALIFDGPGQNAALFRQGLFFRPDWEKVVTPVVDYLLTRPDVDPARIALAGVSQAGYWVPRAVAFEHRIAAAVIDPGVTNVAASWTANLPPAVVHALDAATGPELEQLKAELNQGVAEGMRESAEFRFMVTFRTRPFGAATFADALVLLKDYDLTGVAGQIRCPVLITDPEGEDFWPGQSQRLYDAITGPKTLVKFTAAEGADLHCEPKANGLRSQVMFDWLDETLGLPATAG